MGCGDRAYVCYCTQALAPKCIASRNCLPATRAAAWSVCRPTQPCARRRRTRVAYWRRRVKGMRTRRTGVQLRRWVRDVGMTAWVHSTRACVASCWVMASTLLRRSCSIKALGLHCTLVPLHTPPHPPGAYPVCADHEYFEVVGRSPRDCGRGGVIAIAPMGARAWLFWPRDRRSAAADGKPCDTCCANGRDAARMCASLCTVLTQKTNRRKTRYAAHRRWVWGPPPGPRSLPRPAMPRCCVGRQQANDLHCSRPAQRPNQGSRKQALQRPMCGCVPHRPTCRPLVGGAARSAPCLASSAVSCGETMCACVQTRHGTREL